MINETPAPGEGQTSESEVPSPGSPVTPGDDLRRLAVERLADHLEIGASLIERCETLAFAQRGDRLGPLYAAARLMHAQARVADALAHFAQVERRRRSITERIQTVRPKPQDLIPRIEEKDPLATLQKRLDDILQRERQSGLRPPENPDEASQEAAAGAS